MILEWRLVGLNSMDDAIRITQDMLGLGVCAVGIIECGEEWGY